MPIVVDRIDFKMFKLFAISVVFISLTLVNSYGYKLQSRIVNGVESNIRRYPFFVSLLTKDNENVTKRCSASLISDRWILTAGHCLGNKTKVLAYLGIQQNGKFSETRSINLSNIHIFPEYGSTTNLANDIGLIEVTNPITENAAIRRVNLPTNCGEHIDKSVEFVVAGTGKTTFDTAINGTKGIPNRPLRETRLTTMPYTQCRLLTNTKINIKSVICAVTSGGRSIACGDSGGPMLRSIDNTLIGITSSYLPDDNGVATSNTFTNIHYYLDWISQLTGIHLPKCTYLKN